MATAFLKTKTKRKNKFGAKKTVIGDITFDSKGEAQRWMFLRMMERRGVIRELNNQVTFNISYDTKKICKYVADFVYLKDGKRVVEDFKSSATRTPVYRLKKKLLSVMYGVEIKEVDSYRDAV